MPRTKQKSVPPAAKPKKTPAKSVKKSALKSLQAQETLPLLDGESNAAKPAPLTGHSIAHGDCVAGMLALPAGSVDLVFADPPFNIGYKYDVYQDKRESEHYLDWSREWISAVHTVLKPDGAFWLAIGDEYAAELKVLSQQLGFTCRSWVVWYYTFGVNCKAKFTRSHAHIFHFVKDPNNFTFLNEEPINRIPSARQLVYNDARSNPVGRLPDDTWILRPQDLPEGFTAEEDTWYFPRVAGTFKEREGFHGCQMPEQLLGRIIRLCSRPGEVVLDPFSGSGTTLAVAKKLGRASRGFDLSPDYAKYGTERLEAIRVGDSLSGTVEPTMSAPLTIKTGGARKNAPNIDSAGFFADAATSEARQQAALRVMTEQQLLAAFAATSQGYSLDRVMADPALQTDLHQECRDRDLPGEPRTWNQLLFRLRKAGRLAHVATRERTNFSWTDCDRYLFAVEIALRQMHDQYGVTLDELLADPELASEFDAWCDKLSPGASPLEYRWAALKLRKEAHAARVRKMALTPGRWRGEIELAERDQWPAYTGPAIYEIRAREEKQSSYLGATWNLRERLTTQFSVAQQNFYGDSLQVRYYPTKVTQAADLLGYQILEIEARLPRRNWNGLTGFHGESRKPASAPKTQRRRS
jgi:DNA modification methylase